MNDDDQRLKNLLLFKVYLTDKELEEAGPAFGIIAIVIVVVLVLIACVGGK